MKKKTQMDYLSIVVRIAFGILCIPLVMWIAAVWVSAVRSGWVGILEALS